MATGMAMDMVMARERKRTHLGFVSLLALYGVLHAAESRADTLTVTPKLATSETYTDNISLAPAGQTSAGFITQLAPEITITDVGSRLNLNIDYTLLDYMYDNYGWAHTYYNQLNANADLQLIKKTFFVDVGSTISQQPLTLFGPVSANGSNLTGNVANVKTDTFSSTLEHNFDEEALAQAKVTHVNMDFSYAGAAIGGLYSPTAGPANLNYQNYAFAMSTDTADVFVSNGADFNDFTWKLDYNRNSILYPGYPTATISLLTGDLGYLLTPRFKLNSELGYEHDNFVYYGPAPYGVFWNEGFSWNPSQRTQLQVAAGERFFGRTYLFDLSHRRQHLLLTAGYHEDVTATPMEQFISPAATLDQLLQNQITDPAQRQQTIQQILSALGPQSSLYGYNAITNEIFVSKTFHATLGVTSPRNTLLLTLFDSQVSPLQQSGSSGFNNPLYQFQNYLGFGTYYTAGETMTWSHKLDPFITLTFSDSYTRMSMADIPGQETMNFLLLGISKQVNPKVMESLTYRHQNMNGGMVGGYSYTENALIAGLNFIF